MAKIIKKGNHLEEEYYAIKQARVDKIAKDTRAFCKVAFAAIIIYGAIIAVSVIADIFSLYLHWPVFLGEYSKSRRAFETVYLLICFLLLNMPSFLFQGYVVAVMVIGTAILMPITLMKRLHL